MSQLDLFSMLGLNETKEESKKDVKKDVKKTIGTVVDVPFTLVYGFGLSKIVDCEMLGLDSGVKQVSLSQVKEYYFRTSVYTEGTCVTKVLAKNKIAIILDRSKMVAKGGFKFNLNSHLYFGDDELAISNLQSAEGKEVQLEDIATCIGADQLPPEFGIIQDKDMYFILPGKNHATVSEELSKISIYDPTSGEISNVDIKLSDEDSEDEDSDGEVDNILHEFLENKYPDAKDILDFFDGGKKGCYILSVKQMSSTTSSPVKKEEAYPTTAVISLLFKRIPLSPELFSGKAKISKSEVVEFLVTQYGYQEFVAERTLVKYDKDTNFLFVTLTAGSTKGAGALPVFPSLEDALQYAHAVPDALCNYLEDGKEYRLERTPISITGAAKGDSSKGYFQYFLPKFPRMLFEHIASAFSMVREKYGTEALLWICYNMGTGEYDIVAPPQIALSSSVHTVNSLPLGSLLKVMDIHSHGIFDCSFSETDNIDEKSNLLYGVVVNPGKENERIDMRACTGGYYYNIPLASIVCDGSCEEITDVVLFHMLESSFIV